MALACPGNTHALMAQCMDRIDDLVLPLSSGFEELRMSVSTLTTRTANLEELCKSVHGSRQMEREPYSSSEAELQNNHSSIGKILQNMSFRMQSLESQAVTHQATIDDARQRIDQYQKQLHVMAHISTQTASRRGPLTSTPVEPDNLSICIVEQSVLALKQRLMALESKVEANYHHDALAPQVHGELTDLDLEFHRGVQFHPGREAASVSSRSGVAEKCLALEPVEATETDQKMLSFVAKQANDALRLIGSVEEATAANKDKMDQQMQKLSERILSMESAVSSQQHISSRGPSMTERDLDVECEPTVLEHEEAAQEHDETMPKQEGTHASSLEDFDKECILSKHRLDDADDVYQLQESIWDCCGLIGQPAIGLECSLVLTFGALLNVGLQLSFCLIVFANLSIKEVDDATVEAARHWRGVTGHDITYADPIRRTSLVAQLCAKDHSVHFSSTQYQTHEDYSEFLKPEDFPQFEKLNGQVLCFMALLVWMWSIMVDVLGNFRFTEAIFVQPRGQPCIIVKDGGFMIKSIGVLQLVFAMVMGTLPRLGTSIFLGYVGVKFLAFTTSMGDLVLNAIALTFILGLDELVYDATAPRRVRTLVTQLQPLVVDTGAKKIVDRGGFTGVGFVNVITLTACLLLDNLVLRQYVDLMTQVTEELCGGEKDFVVTKHKGNGLIYYFVTDPLPDPVEYTSDNFPKKSVLELVAGPASNSTIELTSWAAIMRLHNSPLTYAVGLLQCIDHTNIQKVRAFYNQDTSMYYAPLLSLQAEVGQNITRCHQVPLSRCFHYNATALRAICPEHCGCNSPWVGNIFGTPSFGCPVPCQTKFEEALVVMSGAPKKMMSYSNMCSEPPVGLLNSLTSWNNYLAGLEEVIISRGGSQQDANSTITTLKQSGCNAIPFLSSRVMDLCYPDSAGIGRSVRPFCPVKCSCSITNQVECPYGCRCHLGNKSRGECGYPYVQNVNPKNFYNMVNWWIDDKVGHHYSVVGIHQSTITTTANPNSTSAGPQTKR